MLVERSKRTFSCSCSCGIVAVLLMVVSDFRISAQHTNEGIDLETWEAPSEMKKAFPYYISGLDYKGRPVFVMEYGKWNVRKYLEDGGDSKILDIYADHIMFTFNRWSEAERNLPSSENLTSTGLIGMIIDFEGYESSQLTHIPSLAYAMEVSRKFGAPVTGPGAKMEYGYLINMNPEAKVLMTIFAGPLLGDSYSKMKSCGTNREQWVPLLLEQIPKSSLPIEYGGYSNFKPLAVFG